MGRPAFLEMDRFRLIHQIESQIIPAPRKLDREIPRGRLQTADEIAATICWLLSDDARAITGEAVNVSAGQTMV